MKLQFEPIQPCPGSSIRLTHSSGEETCRQHWHYHSQYEVVYIPSGKGMRHIGKHISRYQEGELVFIGPQIPHLRYGYGQQAPFEEIVIQLSEDFLGEAFMKSPEMADIHRLFQRSRQGIAFLGEAKHSIGLRIERLPGLSPFEQLIELLQIFQQMALAAEFLVLDAGQLSPALTGKEPERLNRVYAYVEERFSQDIDVQEIAQLCHLSVPAFCRYFKQMTQMTLTDFINQYRVSQACLLLRQETNIATIAYACGFNNLSHFNKAFRKRIGKTPSRYRQENTLAPTALTGKYSSAILNFPD